MPHDAAQCFRIILAFTGFLLKQYLVIILQYAKESAAHVGSEVGTCVEYNKGCLEGLAEGEIDGKPDGEIDGKAVGLADGKIDGEAVGLTVLL